MLILFDLGFLRCLTAMSPRSVSGSWNFLCWSGRPRGRWRGACGRCSGRRPCGQG